MLIKRILILLYNWITTKQLASKNLFFLSSSRNSNASTTAFAIALALHNTSTESSVIYGVFYFKDNKFSCGQQMTAPQMSKVCTRLIICCWCNCDKGKYMWLTEASFVVPVSFISVWKYTKRHTFLSLIFILYKQFVYYLCESLQEMHGSTEKVSPNYQRTNNMFLLFPTQVLGYSCNSVCIS